MSLYLPAAFDERDLARLDELAGACPFASVVTVAEGEPFVLHVPVLYRRDATGIELLAHVARPNPQARHAGAALAILHGPQAYVSPSWYPDKAAQARVPTWNYVVAHLHGTLETFDDEAQLAHVVSRLAETHESRAGGDWRFDPGNAAERVQLRGIVGFRLRVERAELKSKLSQNHPIANRIAVEERLFASRSAADREVAAWMRAKRLTEAQGYLGRMFVETKHRPLYIVDRFVAPRVG
ncbi:FMN-binding negative transcriptional regulator, partial [Lysobacter xanthus]